MKFLGSLERKQQPEELSRAAFALPGYKIGRPYKDSWDIERAVREGMERVTWVYRCVDAIASNTLLTNVVVRRGDRDEGEEIPDHPLARLLNGYPNPFQDSGTFRYIVSSQLSLSRKGVFIEVKRNRMGEPVALYVLPPMHTHPVPDPRTFVKEFAVEIPNVDRMTIAPQNVIWIRRPHPLFPYEGITPMQAVGLTVDLDFWARAFNRKFLANDARPGGLVGIAGEMDDDTADEVKVKLQNQEPGEVVVVEAENVHYVDTSKTPRDMQYVELLHTTKDEILVAFGVAESVLGNASQRTFENAGVEEEGFWRHTMASHLSIIARGFDRLDGDPDTFTAFDVHNVPILDRDRRERAAFALREVAEGCISRNEYRTETGRDLARDPDMDAFLAPQSVVPIAMDARIEEGEAAVPKA